MNKKKTTTTTAEKKKATTKAKPRKKKATVKEKTEAKSVFSQDLWAIVFLSAGLMIFISLTSYFWNNSDNILGPIFGTQLSYGLVSLVGALPAFYLPIATITLAWFIFRGDPLPVRTYFYTALITLQIIVFTAVHNLPKIAVLKEKFFPPLENNLGNLTVYLFHDIFGKQTFGPYFILTVTMTLTLIIMFRIDVKHHFDTCTNTIMNGLFIVVNSISAIIRKVFYSFKTTKRERIEAPEKEKKDWFAKDTIPSEEESVPVTISGESGEEEKKNPKKKTRKKKEEPLPMESMEDSHHEENPLMDDLPSIQKPDDIIPTTVEAFAMDTSKQTQEPDEATIPITILNNEDSTMPSVVGNSEPVDDSEEEENEEEGGDISEGALADPSLVDDFQGYEKMPTEQEQNTPEEVVNTRPYTIPSPDVIPDPPPVESNYDNEEFQSNARVLEKTLQNFNVKGRVVNICPGPVVTRYEIKLAPGVKISRVVNLLDDISMAVGGKKIRIQAPIPGKSAVGIELPNEDVQIVHFKQILMSDAFQKSKSNLPMIIGKTVSGAPYTTDIAKMPHLLIAGQTGAGKSVGINSFICSLLMTMKPDELRLILIDPKKVEMSYYEGIPHLMAPVVTESKEAVKALQWGVMEMTRRYRLLSKAHARNLESFNKRVEKGTIKEGVISKADNKPLPFIVIVVDELADLMLTASKDVEGLIQRIAQLARAVGIHLIVATQRPSVDIITGPIKANLTSRVSFRTIQSTDSRTILGTVGAEKLLGRGDMLFLRNGAPEIERFHGSFISEEDVEAIVEAINVQEYNTEKIDSFEAIMSDDKQEEVMKTIPVTGGESGKSSARTDKKGRDENFEEAVRLIVTTGLGSTSLIQRRLKLGYARAGRVMDELHEAGVVGPPNGSKAREVLVGTDVLEDMF